MLGAGNLINSNLRTKNLGKMLPSMGLGPVTHRLAKADQLSHAQSGPPRTRETVQFPVAASAAKAGKPSEIKRLAYDADKALRLAREQNPASMDKLLNQMKVKARGGSTPPDPRMMQFLEANYGRNGAKTIFNRRSAARGLNFISSGARSPTARRIGMGGSVAALGLSLGFPELYNMAFPDPTKKVVEGAGGYLTGPIPGIGTPPLSEENWWDKINKGFNLR
jgi:hypothetical protein